ncbi:MAG: DMT family transporter [Bacteroidales bacterium]|nr:DMT family transporter [Candidatus Cryptobacteroides onthequi]
MKKESGIIYDILAVSIVAVWGLTFISTMKLLGHFQPAQIFFIRFAIAYTGMWLFSHKNLFSESLKDEIRLAAAGVMGGSLYFYAENTALQVSHQASCISFIVCTTPLVTSILAVSLHKKGTKMTAPLAIGSAVALAGIAMVMLNGSVFEGIPVGGYILAMVASLTWAVYTILIGDISEKYESAFISRKVFFYGLLTIIPVLLIEGDRFEMKAFLIPEVYTNILFLSVVASLGCYALWTPVIKKLGPVKSSNYIYLNPVFTMFGAILLLGEKMTVLSLIGSGVTLLGVWIAGLKS